VCGILCVYIFFFQAEDGIRDDLVTGVQTCALPISWIDFSQGAVQSTGNPLDVAVSGNAFLTVQTPRGERYTRNGALQVNSQGQQIGRASCRERVERAVGADSVKQNRKSMQCNDRK